MLSVNILSGLGVNTRTLTLTEIISNSSSCKIDIAGNWMHKINGLEKEDAHLIQSQKMLLEANHKNSRDYDTYRAVFEEIENINFSPKRKYRAR